MIWSIVSNSASTYRQARGEYLPPALHKRHLRASRAPHQNFAHIFLLADGSAAIAIDDIDHHLEGRTAFYFPPASDIVITLAAGAEGFLLGVAQELLADVIGNKAESLLLRIFSERPALVSASAPEGLDEVLALAEGFMKEINLPDRGSMMAISSYMRLILMSLWRSGEWESPAEGSHGSELSVLQSYRQLVEIHFRDHWPVASYATELGLTYDRLHAICTRSLGRTPQQLLHQRVLQEATLRLERSGSPVQQIAGDLGFPDPTYFSHFFKRNTGISPNGYRRRARLQQSGQDGRYSAEYADWP
jgi:AraC-like DNA-binding protein